MGGGTQIPGLGAQEPGQAETSHMPRAQRPECVTPPRLPLDWLTDVYRIYRRAGASIGLGKQDGLIVPLLALSASHQSTHSHRPAGSIWKAT